MIRTVPHRYARVAAIVMVAIGAGLPPALRDVRGQQSPAGGVSDWGLASAGPFTTLTALEIRNDTDVDRVGEVAFSAVPIARLTDLRGVSELAVVSPDGRRIPAQFSPVSRWGGAPHDAALPIRWLEVTVSTAAPPHTTVVYELRRYAALAASAHPDDLRVVEAGGAHTVHTGGAAFELDPSLPALVRTIMRDDAIVYRHTSDAGPRVVDRSGARLAARVDPGSFTWETLGPVRAVARLRGHFTRAAAACGRDLAYDVRLTFERGSADIGIEYHVVNECGDGLQPAGRLSDGAPWWNRTYAVNEVSWNFPFALARAREIAARGAGATHRRAALDDAGSFVAEQEPGTPGAVYRRARITRDGNELETAAAFENPFVAVADDRITAMLQQPWMRYREPQALAIQSAMLSLRTISRPTVIGEAQAVWGLGRLTLLDGNQIDALDAAAEQARVALERGLLVHAPVAYLDSTAVMPPLSPSGSDPYRASYQSALEQVHEETVRPGAQWDRRKIFGVLLWPDYPADPLVETINQPSATQPGSNYWSASAAELRQWFVDGDPRWVWDFALPQEYTQLFTNYYNLGSRNNQEAGNYRGGFTVVAGSGAVPGEVFRSGWGSDDYTYNQGSDEAYLIRPGGALRDRFAQAADTFIRRYGPAGIPPDAQRRRDRDLQALTIARGTAQRVNFLGYAAQFVPGAGARYVSSLTAVMNEYVQDNLRGGIFCQADVANEQACVGTWGIYHFVAVQLGMFLDYLYMVPPDDPRAAAIRRAIAVTADQYYRVLMDPSGDGVIDAPADWYGQLDCTFRDGGATLAGCTGHRTPEPVYSHEQPGALAFLLVAHHLLPSDRMCRAAAAALPRALTTGLTYLQSGAGWNKGAAQSAHHVLHAVAIAPRCS